MKLKPCPFCGCDNLRVKNYDIAEKQYATSVSCMVCYADGPLASSERIAIEKWNQRPRTEVKDIRDELLTACIETHTYRDLYQRCMELVDRNEATAVHAEEGKK